MVKSSASPAGTLYVIATPIGNLKDISLRALDTLKRVNLIIAEDTRHSRPLLALFDIHKPLISLHIHNEAKQTHELLKALEQGQTLALISDAGTPLISDPGFPLVKLAREKEIPVIPIPGPCALIAALSAAGVPCDSFTFAGFLPAKQNARLEKLIQLKTSVNTIVLYESTHRILACLENIKSIYGNQYQLVLAKELTKTFERFISGTAQNIYNQLVTDKANVKGEFVLILPIAPEKPNQNREVEVLTVLLDELPLNQAVKIASQLCKVSKNKMYKLALTLT